MKKIFFALLACALVAGCGSRDAQKQQMSSAEYIEQGKSALLKGDIAGGVKLFQQAVAKNPRDSRAWFVMAEVQMRMGEYQRAAESFSRVSLLEPQNGIASLLAGNCYELLKEKDKAVESIQKSIIAFQQNKDQKNFRVAVATLRRLVGDGDKAPDAAGSPVVQDTAGNP